MTKKLGVSKGRRDRPVGVGASASSTLGQIDLREALQVLRRAGCPDPPADEYSEAARVEYVLRALCELTIYDGLTGLMSARQFRSILEQESERSFRTGQPCALLLLDLDHFKTINDQRGHLAGDWALQAVGQTIKAGIRTMDTAARYGGEEFAVILPNTVQPNAVKIAERLRGRLEQEVIPFESVVIPVTCSIGVACLTSQVRRTGTELLKMADLQLYRAKRLGRNRVCCDERDGFSASPDERMALSDCSKNDHGKG